MQAAEPVFVVFPHNYDALTEEPSRTGYWLQTQSLNARQVMLRTVLW